MIWQDSHKFWLDYLCSSCIETLMKVRQDELEVGEAEVSSMVVSCPVVC